MLFNWRGAPLVELLELLNKAMENNSSLFLNPKLLGVGLTLLVLFPDLHHFICSNNDAFLGLTTLFLRQFY